ncbi:MAG: hypothetical protein ACKPKO_22715 [Candidatus Fonsibacter sp.]
MRTKDNIYKKTVPIQYYPEDSTAPLPEPPINKQDLTSNYYYV